MIRIAKRNNVGNVSGKKLGIKQCNNHSKCITLLCMTKKFFPVFLQNVFAYFYARGRVNENKDASFPLKVMEEKIRFFSHKF